MLHGEKKFKQSKAFASKHNAKGIDIIDFRYMAIASKVSADDLIDTAITSYEIGFLDGYRKALSEKGGK